MSCDHFISDDIEKILISEEEIKRKVKELAEKISIDYKDKNLFVVGILRGSVIFLADVMKNITIPMGLDFMAISSYNSGAVSSGNVQIKLDVSCDLMDKDVLIVEDIIDSGSTLKFLTEIFKERSAASVEICCLLDKPDRRKANVKVNVKYLGFSVPDEFVVGYGLDYAESYRNFPYVGVLKRAIYE